MKAVRWMLCFPAAAALSLMVFLAIGKLGLAWSYFPQDWMRSLLRLTPYFIMTSLPCAIFVISSTALAPDKKRAVVVVSAIVGCLFSNQVSFIFLTGDTVIDSVGFCASLFGIAVGALTGVFLARTPIEKPG